jgi:hypothetical protein
MPQVDVQWPSEGEDFDAKADTSPSKTAVKSKPSITKVVSKPDSEPEPAVEEAAPTVTEAPVSEAEDTQEVPEEPQTAPETEAPEPEQAPVADSPEPAAEEVPEAAPVTDSQPDPDPVVENEAANLAADVDSQPAAVSEVPVVKKPKGSMMPKFNKSAMRMVGEGLLVLAVIGLGIWSWSLYNDRKDLQSQVNTLNSDPQSVVQKQTQQLITRVGALMQLPTGETPTVAEVSDASQAKQQSSFFNKAQNGDRVLMYVKAGEAVLYRPSTNKIILVAPLVFTNTGSSAGTSSTNNTPATTTGTTPSTTTKK